MDLETFLVSLYVLIDDWWLAERMPPTRKPGRPPRRPPRLTDFEVLALAVLAQWPRFRSERDFWRFAQAHLRSYFPTLCSQSQFNRRVRALAPQLRAFQHDLARTLAKSSVVYRLLDTTLTPAIVRARACRKGLFAGQASFGRNVSKTEWVYGFKVALVVDADGIVSAFGLAPANCDERPIGDALIAQDRHDAYLADKGFASIEWERHWLKTYGALVAATLKNSDRRVWPRTARRWASGKRQVVEGVIDQLKDLFALERHRTKTLSGLLTRLTAKIAAYTCGQCLNDRLGRPLRHVADLLI